MFENYLRLSGGPGNTMIANGRRLSKASFGEKNPVIPKAFPPLEMPAGDIRAIGKSEGLNEYYTPLFAGQNIIKKEIL